MLLSLFLFNKIFLLSIIYSSEVTIFVSPLVLKILFFSSYSASSVVIILFLLSINFTLSLKITVLFLSYSA